MNISSNGTMYRVRHKIWFIIIYLLFMSRTIMYTLFAASTYKSSLRTMKTLCITALA